MTGPGSEAAGAGDAAPAAAPGGEGPVALIVMDPDGTVVWFSAEAARLFGYAESEVVGVELAELIIPEELRAAHVSGLARYRETGTGPVLDNTFAMPAVRKDGTELRVHLTVSPMR